MKITFILPGGGRSGGIKSTVIAANGLLERGHQARLLVNNKKASIKSQLRSMWLTFRYSMSSDWLYKFEGTVERFSDLKECDFQDNEIVVASGWWAAEKLRSVNLPGIIKVHHIRGVGFHDNDKMRELWGEDVPKIAVASYLEEVIEKSCGQKLTAVVPNGIDVNEYYSAGSEKQRNGVGTIFGSGYHKDPETVVKVMDKLRKDCPTIPQRVFGSYRKPKDIPQESYSRLPSMEKIRDIYSQSLVWIMASRSEGLPNPVFEAMACGCVVVATDCGGPRDIITDGENGFLVEVGNVKQIVDRVKMLLEDEQLRQSFVQNSKETVRKFSWDSSVDKLEEVLNNLTRSGCDDGEN